MKQFTLTDDHLTLLRAANVRWDNCETGAPAIDSKRPYGNSDVPGDVAKLLGWRATDGSEETEEDAYELHRQTLDALHVLIQLAEIEPGDYAFDREIGWFRVDPELGPTRTLALLTNQGVPQ